MFQPPSCDVVPDPLGGNNWRKGLKLLRPCGRLVAFGFANLTKGERRNPVHFASQVAGIPLLAPLQLMNHTWTVERAGGLGRGGPGPR